MKKIKESSEDFNTHYENLQQVAKIFPLNIYLIIILIVFFKSFFKIYGIIQNTFIKNVAHVHF